MNTFGFFTGGWRKVGEDVLHIGVGLVPFWGWWREMRQWPPGTPLQFAVDDPEMYTELDRVEDAYRDFLGYAIGSVIRTAVLVGLFVWEWN